VGRRSRPRFEKFVVTRGTLSRLNGGNDADRRARVFSIAAIAIAPGSGMAIQVTVVQFKQPRDGTQLHHVTVDGLAEWIAWWDVEEASA
jgi:hypothetical protein